MRNIKSEIKQYGSLIKECANFNPDLINSLSNYQKNELMKLINMSVSGIVPYSFMDSINDENDIEEVLYNKKYGIEEKELNRRIFEGYMNKISELIERDLFPIQREHPTYGGCSVDITAKDIKEQEFWILELKSECADHQILGQCIKYIQFFEDRLLYELYEKVRAVTVCGGYKRFTLTELKKMGIITIKYENVCGSLSFERV